MGTAYAGFVDLSYKPTKKDLVVEFYVEPNRMSVRQAAEYIAGESSIGTWTEVKTMKKRIKDLAPKVYDIHENWIKIAYPAELFEGGNMPEILSSVAGNIYGMKAINKLRVEDIYFPPVLDKTFKGPKYGIPGIRKLTKVKKRPLVGTIVKPKVGLNPKEHAKVAYEAWVGGLDIVKDDENLTNQKFNPFDKRIRETLKMRDKAEEETGEKKIYMPNITAETNEMLKRGKLVKKLGGEYVMIDIITIGWAGVQTVRDANLGVIHAHRAMHGALTRLPNHGMSMLAIAKIAREIGVDQLHIGTAVGKMHGGPREVQTIEEGIEDKLIKKNDHSHVLAEEWGSMKPVFAVASGGLYPGAIQKLMKIMGNDIVIQAGGGVHGHPKGTRAGAKAMRQAVNASMNGVSLKEYAVYHPELKQALEKWGVL